MTKQQEQLDSRIGRLENDCIARLRELTASIDSITRAVKSPAGHLNELGELQGVTTILDCRLACLGLLRQLRSDLSPDAP